MFQSTYHNHSISFEYQLIAKIYTIKDIQQVEMPFRIIILCHVKD